MTKRTLHPCISQTIFEVEMVDTLMLSAHLPFKVVKVYAGGAVSGKIILGLTQSGMYLHICTDSYLSVLGHMYRVIHLNPTFLGYTVYA